RARVTDSRRDARFSVGDDHARGALLIALLQSHEVEAGAKPAAGGKVQFLPAGAAGREITLDLPAARDVQQLDARGCGFAERELEPHPAVARRVRERA